MEIELSTILVFDAEEYQTLFKENQHAFASTSRYTWLKTNNTGKKILDKCDGVRTITDIINEIADEHDLPIEMVREHVLAFAQRGLKKGILRFPDTIPTIEKAPELRHLQIQVSNFCQLSCSYCSRTMIRERDSATFISPQTLDEWLCKLSSLVNRGTTMITLSGGMLEHHPHLTELMEIARKYSEHLSLQLSGGVNPTHALIEAIKKHAKYVVIRLDSVVRNNNDLVRGPGSYDTAITFAKTCEAEKINTFFLTTPTKETLKELEEIIEFSNRMRVSGVILAQPFYCCENGEPVQSASKFDKDDFFKKEAKMARKVQLFNSWRNGTLKNPENVGKNFYLIRPVYSCINNLNYIIPKSNCGAGTSKLMIGVDGHLFGCPAMQIRSLSLGHATTGIRPNSTLLPPDSCQGCFFKVFCGGGCRAESIYRDGNPNGAPLRCEDIKHTFSDWLWDLAIAVPPAGNKPR